MIILSCSDLSLSFGVKKVLEQISFTIQEKDKVGLIGVNGAGKSTLFKLLTGELAADSGDVFISKSLRIGYLHQNTGLDSTKTLWEEALHTFAPLIEMENKLRVLESRISEAAGSESLDSMMKEYDTLSASFSGQGGYEYLSRTRGILKGLGFAEEQHHLPVAALSGGQKTRLAMARLLLQEPDILLLDEPTNHLDISAIEWLEDFLKNYRKCVLVISHDRYFLDEVTTHTLELENCRCCSYEGNYSYYVKKKAEDRTIQQKHYEVQQKEIARLEAFIEQQRRWNREKNIIAAESRQKAIDRMDKIDRPEDLPDKIRIRFRIGMQSGNDVLAVKGLSKEYPGKPLFRQLHFALKRQERTFILGPNGCGKSTLLKILADKLEPSEGTFSFGYKVKLGYYDQEHSDLHEDHTVIDEVWSADEDITQTELRTTLAAFLFRGEDVFSPISILSGGEKSRVALAKLMLSHANVLLLDEPTNHLDINSREVLEEALQEYEGTMLVVSHDRYFIKKLSTRIIELHGDTVTDLEGSYEYYLERRKALSQQETGMGDRKVSAAKAERQASKEERARQRKLEKQLLEAEQAIEKAEARLAEIEGEMLSDAVAVDHVRLASLHQEQQELSETLEKLYGEWEELSLQKEEMLL